MLTGLMVLIEFVKELWEEKYKTCFCGHKKVAENNTWVFPEIQMSAVKWQRVLGENTDDF